MELLAQSAQANAEGRKEAAHWLLDAVLATPAHEVECRLTDPDSLAQPDPRVAVDTVATAGTEPI